jgi:ABC-type sugar transport system substrate-binding protein
MPVEETGGIFAAYQQGLFTGLTTGGAAYVNFNANASTATENQGVIEATNRKAAGLVLLAVTPSFVQTNLNTALKQNMKVIDVLNGTFTAPLNGLYTHITPDLSRVGAVEADEALAATSCKLTAGIVTEPAFDFSQGVAAGVKAEVASLCPTCKTYTGDVDATNIPTNTAQATSSLLTSHPQINAMLAMNDQMADYVGPQLRSLGKNSSVKLFGVNAESANLKNVQNGTQAGDVFFSPYLYLGWQTAYQLFRAVLGLPTTATALTPQAVVQSNASSVATEQSSSSFVPAFKAAITK